MTADPTMADARIDASIRRAEALVRDPKDLVAGARLYPYADPLGSLILNVFQPGWRSLRVWTKRGRP